MYAQLCKRLAENAPNFDPPDKPCTFRRLLLNKCRDEFENRAQIAVQYEKLANAAGNAGVGALTGPKVRERNELCWWRKKEC